MIHMLPKISRINGNQATKFGLLIEYNIRYIFLEKSYTKCDSETCPRPFSKKSELSISLDEQSEILQFAFIVYSS